MQIKRRLSALAKRFDNNVEGLNIVIELNRICDRLDELADYAEAKEERAKEFEKTGKSLAVRQAEAIKAKRDEVAAAQLAEVNEQLADQKEAKTEAKKPVAEAE